MEKKQAKYDDAILTVRFLGDTIDNQGVSIYDFAETLSSIQTIVNKAHLSKEGRLKKGAFPTKAERRRISLSIGERRRTSDAFALVPLLTDPATRDYLMTVAGYIVEGLVGFVVGDVMKRIKGDASAPQVGGEQKLFIGSIYTEVLNIVDRIDASGGVKSIQIGAPSQPTPVALDFDEPKKEYVRHLSNEYVLGPNRTIQGEVYRLYPNSRVVTIRRDTNKRKVNVSLFQSDFDGIRYDQSDQLSVKFKGRPRYRFGIESQAITDFEADSIEILPDDET